MFFFSSFVFFSLLHLSISQPFSIPSPPPFDDRPDPKCKRGQLGGVVCCPAICGECGGTGCNLRPGGILCCQGIVMSLGRECPSFGPPCTIPTPSPRPMWKNIDGTVAGSFMKRAEACFVMVNGKAYLLGGRGGRHRVEIFDPSRRLWTKGAIAPIEFHHATCTKVMFSIFVTTSWRGKFPREKQNSKMLVYDTRKNRWTMRNGLPEPRRRGAAAAALFDRKIWVVGGARNGHGIGSKTVPFLDYYDLKKRLWVTGLAPIPSRRDHAGAEVIKNRLCVAAGRLGDSKRFYSAVRLSTWCYNFKLKKWMNVRAPIPVGRSNSMYAKTCDGKMMVAGGERPRLTAFKRVDVFDGVKWTHVVNLDRPRHGTGLAVSNCQTCGQIFTAAGQGSREFRKKLNSTEVFFPGGVDIKCKKF